MKVLQIFESADQLSQEDVTALISGDFSQAYKQYKEGNILYRGVHVNIPFLIQEPKPERQAANTHYNFHNLIFRKGWPARSTIMSADKGYAAIYGSLYICLPKNGAKLGVCPEQDIWNSFHKIESLLPYADSNMQHLVSYVYNALDTTIDYLNRLDNISSEDKTAINKIKRNNSEEVYALVRKLDNLVNSLPVDQKHNLFQTDDTLYTIFGDNDDDDEEQGFGGFFYFMQEVFTDEDFEEISISEMDEIGEINEVWTDAPVLLISEKALSVIDNDYATALTAYKLFLEYLSKTINTSNVKYDKVDSLDRGDKVNISFNVGDHEVYIVVEFLKEVAKDKLKVKQADVSIDGEKKSFVWKGFDEVTDYITSKIK